MAKVFGIHEIELRPGVTAEEFEQFYREEASQAATLEGWKGYLLKGDRGEREGKYVFLVEIESIEARDRYSPTPDETSEEAKRIVESSADVWEKLRRLATIPGEDTMYTDYIVVSD
jgi:hypothetical protein